MQLSVIPRAQGLIPPTRLGTASRSKVQLRFGSAQQLCPGMWALQQTIMIIASDNNRQKMFVSWQHRKQTPSRACVRQPSQTAQPVPPWLMPPTFVTAGPDSVCCCAPTGSEAKRAWVTRSQSCPHPETAVTVTHGAVVAQIGIPAMLSPTKVSQSELILSTSPKWGCTR